MPNYSRPIAGLGSVGSYQIAGHPYITGSSGLGDTQTAKVTFPTVARSVTVINRTAQASGAHSTYPGLWVHFTKDKAATDDANAHVGTRKAGNYTWDGKHFVTLPNPDDSFTFNVRCKEIYITNKLGASARYEVFAELTGIPTGSMYELTGSGTTSDPADATPWD